MKRILLMALAILLLVGCSSVDTEKFYENYMDGKEYFTQSASLREQGNYYYDLFVKDYEDYNYAEAILYCQEARKFYKESNSAQNYAMEYFNISHGYATKEYKQLLEHYVDYGKVVIEFNWNNFEICEYLEAASYDFMNENYDEGDKELSSANEKIATRDSLVEDINSLATKIEVYSKASGLD